VEYRGGIGVDVGYAANTTIAHNQIDHNPYSGVSIGWGGWPDKAGKPGIANFSHGNVVSNNLIFNIVQGLGDGAAVYSNGQTGSSFASGEHVTGNVMHDLGNIFHMINTDNGTDWMTVTGNGSWNTGPANSWGTATTTSTPARAVDSTTRTSPATTGTTAPATAATGSYPRTRATATSPGTTTSPRRARYRRASSRAPAWSRRSVGC
jgi:hypothetical protein